MLRGLYTAASGLTSIMFRNDIETNNLINSQTTGYKKEEVIFKSFQSTLNHMMSYEKADISSSVPIGKLGKGVQVDDVVTYFDQQGDLVHTDGDLDLAIKGEGYLVVEDSAGKQYFTRNGAFNLNQNGQLINDEGYLVQAQKGPIKVNGQQIDIQKDGSVYVDGQYVDRLQIVNIEQPKKYGQNLFTSDYPPQEVSGVILQGYLEKSNTNPIEGMTKYLKNLRAYESNQKIVQAYDSTLEKAINEVGQV